MPMLIGHRRRGGLVPVPVPVPVLFSSLVIGGKRADDGGQWTVVDGGGGGLSKGRGLMGATGCRWMMRCLAAMPMRWRCLFDATTHRKRPQGTARYQHPMWLDLPRSTFDPLDDDNK